MPCQFRSLSMNGRRPEMPERKAIAYAVVKKRKLTARAQINSNRDLACEEGCWDGLTVLPDLCLAAVTSFLTLIDARIARTANKRLCKRLEPNFYCVELGCVLMDLWDPEKLLEPRPVALRVLELCGVRATRPRRTAMALRAPKLAAEFPQLRKLVLCAVLGPIDLSPLAGLKHLESLHLIGIPEIRTTYTPRRRAGLKHLKSFTSLAQINTLTELNFMESNVLDSDDVRALATFKNLRSLGFCGCRDLPALWLFESIRKLELLERLDLCDVHGSMRSGLGYSRSLKYLNLAEQKLSMYDFNVLSKQTSLQELVVDNSDDPDFRAGVRWFCTQNPTVVVRHPRENENEVMCSRLKSVRGSLISQRERESERERARERKRERKQERERERERVGEREREGERE